MIMIYQVKIDQAVLFMGNTKDVIEYLRNPRYPIEHLVVHGYEMGVQTLSVPYKEPATSFIK